MEVVYREDDVRVDPVYVFKCLRCERELSLWLNGGELDSKACCGLEYRLESPRIDFVVTRGA